MDIKEILQQQPEEVYKALAVKPSRTVSLDKCQKQYNPLKHDVFDQVIRKQKEVMKATDRKDATTGEIEYEKKMEEVVRIGIPMQKLIVNRSIGFLLGNPIELEESYHTESKNSEKVLEMVKKIWEDNKLDFTNREIAEILLSECEVAELWYLQEDKEYWGELSNAKLRLRLKILSSRSKDDLFPYFDEYGDMVAFCRAYTVSADEKEYKHFDVYTDEKNYLFQKGEGDWELLDTVDSPGKICVIYHKIEKPDWFDVQTMIDRLEERLSNTGDTNDYTGDPMTIVKGKVTGFATKGDRGKIMEIDKDGDITLLESKNTPESVKLELDTLKELIYTMTQTPNISFESVKGLGNITGIALKMLFLDAHMKAEKNWGFFGAGIQRRLNLLKHIVGEIDASLSKDAKNLTIKTSFTPYLPTDDEIWNKMVTDSLALGGISKQTAAENLTFVSDPEQEVERIKDERKEDLGAIAT